MSAPRKYVREVKLKSMKQNTRMKNRIRVDVKNEKHTLICLSCLFHSMSSSSCDIESLLPSRRGVLEERFDFDFIQKNENVPALFPDSFF